MNPLSLSLIVLQKQLQTHKKKYRITSDLSLNVVHTQLTVGEDFGSIPFPVPPTLVFKSLLAPKTRVTKWDNTSRPSYVISPGVSNMEPTALVIFFLLLCPSFHHFSDWRYKSIPTSCHQSVTSTLHYLDTSNTCTIWSKSDIVIIFTDIAIVI